MNASDERGISVVRDKIKQFASLTVGNGNNSKSASSFFTTKDQETANDDAPKNESSEIRYPNPPFKIIILDEAGALDR